MRLLIFLFLLGAAEAGAHKFASDNAQAENCFEFDLSSVGSTSCGVTFIWIGPNNNLETEDFRNRNLPGSLDELAELLEEVQIIDINEEY